MSSRQSTVALTVSQNGLQYAAPNTFAVVENDVFRDVELGNPANTGVNNGTGANSVATQVFPIANGSTSGQNGLTSSGTTATCTLGTPHGFANGASSVTVTVTANNAAYNVTGATATITGPYTFTYTTTGSGLATSQGGTVAIIVPAWSLVQSDLAPSSSPLPAGTTAGTTGIPYSVALVGATIRGSTVGPLEYWGDGTMWDTSNNRSLFPGIDFDNPVQYKSA
jgi:hypothetical protein